MFKGFDQLFGVDLGTSNTLIYQAGKGIVLQEPSVVAIHTETGKIAAIGTEAEAMIGRTPGSLEVVHPLKDGVIANFDVTSAMLKHFIGKIQASRLFFRGTQICIAVPCGITNVQRRAVEETVIHKGARKAIVIDEPLAAAWGAGLPVNEPTGSMILDIGGGTSQVAVISLGGIVVSHAVRRGGMSIDQDIIEYVKKAYSLEIGQRTAEDIKVKIASAVLPEQDLRIDVKGRDLVQGLPRSISLCADEIFELLEPFLTSITESIRITLEKCPPELAGDLIERGITLCGGGALLQGLSQRLQMDTGVPFHLPELPLECTVLGVGKMLGGKIRSAS
ncbi:rod shape-determining protein [Paenibacillus contaminans]|uniref:Cell shape-determining protein MreB n=1 Tax=Paenibacillus contaminans TaxID=450362 RepID=A0A329MMY8_9BACL|nr:rod shape-determining protein [Paenibacillus contaminans]RAV20980.1 rod shape-determining protein [Paenibacillus contaminans]